MCMAHIVTGDHADTPGLSSCLGPGKCLKAMENWPHSSQAVIFHSTSPWLQHSGELMSPAG